MRSGDDGQVPAPGGDSRDGTGAESRAASPLSQELGCRQHIRQHLWITWDRSQAPAPPFPNGSQGQESLGMLAQPRGGEMGPAGAAQDTGKVVQLGEERRAGTEPQSQLSKPEFQGGFDVKFSFLGMEWFRHFGNAWPGSYRACRASSQPSCSAPGSLSAQCSVSLWRIHKENCHRKPIPPLFGKNPITFFLFHSGSPVL